jgi:hypothetical protein
VLGELAADSGERQRLGAAARRWVVAHRSWGANADILERLYSRLAPGWRR